MQPFTFWLHAQGWDCCWARRRFCFAFIQLPKIFPDEIETPEEFWLRSYPDHVVVLGRHTGRWEGEMVSRLNVSMYIYRYILRGCFVGLACPASLLWLWRCALLRKAVEKSCESRWLANSVHPKASQHFRLKPAEAEAVSVNYRTSIFRRGNMPVYISFIPVRSSPTSSVRGFHPLLINVGSSPSLFLKNH